MRSELPGGVAQPLHQKKNDKGMVAFCEIGSLPMVSEGATATATATAIPP